MSNNKDIINSAKKEAAKEIIATIVDAIKEATQKSMLKGVPSGELFSMLSSVGMDLSTYTDIIEMFKKAGMVKQSNNVLSWIGKL